MSFVVAVPDAVATAAENVANIGSTLNAASSAAAANTTGVLAAASDEVSTAIASLFSSHAAQYQYASAQAAAFHAQFVQLLQGAGGAYAATEAASANPLQTIAQDVLGVINTPTQLVLGRPLIGNGTDGAAGPAGSCSVTVAPEARAGSDRSVAPVARPV